MSQKISLKIFILIMIVNLVPSWTLAKSPLSERIHSFLNNSQLRKIDKSTRTTIPSDIPSEAVFIESNQECSTESTNFNLTCLRGNPEALKGVDEKGIERIDLTLPNGPVVAIHKTRYEKIKYGTVCQEKWFGGSRPGYSDTLLIRCGNRLLGSLMLKEGSFEIKSINPIQKDNSFTTNHYVFFQKNSEDDFKDDVVRDTIPLTRQKNLTSHSSNSMFLHLDPSDFPQSPENNIPPAPVTVDILVICEPLLMEPQGFAWQGCQLEAFLAVELLNIALENSLVPHRARSVGAVPWNEQEIEIQDFENTGQLVSAILQSQFGPKARNRHGADLVSIWPSDLEKKLEGKSFACAPFIRRYPTGSSNCHFSVVRINSSEDWNGALTLKASPRTFVHEIGHNFGASHDIYTESLDFSSSIDINDDLVSDNLDYYNAFGYVSLQGQFNTVMASNYQCQAAGIHCPPVLYFSNPKVQITNPLSPPNPPLVILYNAGDGVSDVASLFLKSIPAVSRYRSAAPKDEITLAANYEINPVVEGFSYRQQIQGLVYSNLGKTGFQPILRAAPNYERSCLTQSCPRDEILTYDPELNRYRYTAERVTYYTDALFGGVQAHSSMGGHTELSFVENNLTIDSARAYPILSHTDPTFPNIPQIQSLQEIQITAAASYDPQQSTQPELYVSVVGCFQREKMNYDASAQEYHTRLTCRDGFIEKTLLVESSLGAFVTQEIESYQWPLDLNP